MRTTANEPHVRLDSAALGDEAKEHQTLWEALVWAYRRQCVDAMSNRSLFRMERAIDGQEPRDRSRDGVATMMERGRLGCAIDGGAGMDGVAAVSCHPDAELLHDLVMGLESAQAALLIRYAYKEEQPEPSLVPPHPLHTHPDLQHADKTLRDDYEVHEPENGPRLVYKVAVADRVTVTVPVMARAGRAGMKQVGTKEVVVEVKYSPIEWWPPIEMIEMNNFIHRTWVSAMKALWCQIGQKPFRDRTLTEIGFYVPTITPASVKMDASGRRQPVVNVSCTPAVSVITVGEGDEQHRELRERLASARHAR